MRLYVVATAVVLGGCNLIFPKPEGPAAPPKAPPTRAEIDRALRDELAAQSGDACTGTKWISARALKASGLEAEVAEELKAETIAACRRERGGGTLAETTTTREPEPLVFEGACTRAVAEAKLRERGGDSPITKAVIEDAFAACFSTRLAACQSALDADIGQGVACWRKHAWPETPAAIQAGDIGATEMCLGELSAVVADLRTCAAKKPAERDACVTPYVGYVPKCALLDATQAWKSFPGAADVERVASADAKRRAERDATIAKEKADREARLAAEVARCHGRTTIELATRVAREPTLAKVPGCRYEVAGTVLSKNNVYVQLADASGKIVFLVRTREAIDAANAMPRYARFDTVETAELADGTTQKFAVFVLEATTR